MGQSLKFVVWICGLDMWSGFQRFRMRDGKRDSVTMGKGVVRLRAERSKRTMLIGAWLTVALLLGFSLNSHVQRSTQFTARLEWAGTTEKYSAFDFSLTNRSLAPGGPKRILFEWMEKAGGIGSCHAELYRPGTQYNGVLVAHIGVPPDAKKVRVFVCGPPAPARQRVQGLLGKLPWRFQRLFPSKWIYTDEVYSLLLPWTANPALRATATPPRS
jgi:hypothetical protein